MNYIELSKAVSYILRHAPQENKISLDSFGWTNIAELIPVLQKNFNFQELTVEDLTIMIQTSKKKRHEIENGRIRALYGHSTEDKVVKNVLQPPDILYHGTSRQFASAILQEGLLSQERQYVHMSNDKETAWIVGLRKDNNPVILKINSEMAWKDGIVFYKGNEDIWLADFVPVQYLELLESQH